MEARRWLRANGYTTEAELIDEMIAEWRMEGKGTRRNWWDVLAGRANGERCVIAGRKFTILRAAQIRQGRPVTENAICKDTNEEVPSKVVSGRWKSKTQITRHSSH